jgi:hypothetical protein
VLHAGHKDVLNLCVSNHKQGDGWYVTPKSLPVNLMWWGCPTAYYGLIGSLNCAVIVSQLRNVRNATRVVIWVLFTTLSELSYRKPDSPYHHSL